MTDCASHPQLHRLIEIVDRLRAPGGCPWDREQTETSMAPHLLEEAFEAVDALQSGDAATSAEELGDVLMNVLMIARIASETGRYGLDEVCAAIADKLIRRHPHVFGEVQAETAAEVLQNWEAIKRREGGREASPKSVLAGVPRALPALMRAHRIGQKVARVGFDWPDADGPREKLDEELAELDEALRDGDAKAIEHELGDVLFSLCNVARHAGIDPEMALRSTVDRFAARFRHVEERLGARLESASLTEMEALWQESKRRDPA